MGTAANSIDQTIMGRRGALILIEGLDRAGKSSQCDILKRRIESELNAPVELLKFPDRTTEIGQVLDRYLKREGSEQVCDQAIHLLFSANRWELAGKILNHLKAGTNVVMDRYVYSGLAFSAAKGIPGMSVHWCRQPDVGLPAPDLTIFLDISEDVAQARSGYGDEVYETGQFQQKVRLMFQELGNTVARQDTWVTISADRALDEISDDIFARVQPYLTRSLGPIKVFT